MWRWLLGTTLDSVDVSLMTQALPCSINTVNSNPHLQADHSRGLIVSKYPVLFDKYDDPSVLGPAPTYFSNDPDKTRRELQESPAYAYECLQILVSKLLARKELSIAEATAYLKNPLEKDASTNLKGSWQSKQQPTSRSSIHTPTDKGKTGRGKHAKKSSSGPSAAKQPRLSEDSRDTTAATKKKTDSTKGKKSQ